MAHVFVSHAIEDLDIARRITQWLRDAGNTVFLAHDPEHGLGVGDAWLRRLFDELYKADALVAVVTFAYGPSPWCAAEVGVALANGVRILPVQAEPGASHRMVSSETQWAVLEGDGAGARTSLVAALRRLDGAGGTAWSRGMPLYPGLAAFDAGQARVFFGRRSESRQLAERLRAPVGPAGGGLLAVVGPSGCGKSSLVRAGLVPLLAEDPNWLVLPPLIPAADPVAVLVRLLTAEGRRRGLDWTAGQVGDVMGRPGGLLRLAADLLANAAPAGRLLLVVDQAEELLTRAPEAARRQFAVLLLEASGGPVRVVAPVRSEFLDPLATLAADVGLPMDSFVLLPLVRDMLPLVITGPARHAGIRVDDELVARMVADTGGGDALPLLAFVLEQLADGIDRGGELSAKRYESLGGVRGALSLHANIALREAAAASGRTSADVLAGLLRLVTIDERGQVTRRGAELSGMPANVRTELQVFVDHRLLTVRGGGDAESGPPVVEVAHEQILTAWKPLADTIAAATDSLRLHTDTVNAADNWQRTGRPANHLWELSRATTAQRTLDPGDLTPTTHAFLVASRRHGQTRRRRAIAILSTLLLLVTTGGITALAQWRTAVNRQHDIETAQRLAVARELLASADAARNNDPRAALRYALAANALASSDQPTSDRATSNLLDTLADTPYLARSMEAHTGPVRSVAFSPNGRILATGGDDGSVFLWDVADSAGPRRLGQLTGHSGAVYSVAFSGDRRTLAAGSTAGSVFLWDVADSADPRPLGSLLLDITGPVYSVAFSGDGRTLATGGGAAGTVVLWDVADPADSADLHDPRRREGLPTGHLGAVWSVAFGGDGHTLATGGDDGAVFLWDVADLARPRRIGGALTGHSGPVRSVAFTGDDGHTLATGSDDGTVILWDVAELARPSRIGEALTGHSGPVRSAALTGDGRTLATGGDDGTVILWDVTGSVRPYRFGEALTGHTGPVSSVAFSGDGHTLATGSDDGTVILWDAVDPADPRRIGDVQVRYAGPVYSVAFTRDGRTMATGSDGGTVILWDVVDPADPRRIDSTLTRVVNPVRSVAFSVNGHTLAGGFSHSVVLWDVAGLRPIGDLLAGHTDTVVSVLFRDNEHTLATGSDDGTVILWDVTDPAHPRRLGDPLSGHTGPVSSMAFSGDGHILATGGDDGTVILWDVTDPADLHRLGDVLSGHTGPVSSMAFSADGHTLATGSDDGTVILWDTSVLNRLRKDARSIACQRAGRGLTSAEWATYVPGLPYEPTC